MRVGVTVVNMDCEHFARESMEYLVANTSKDSLVFLTDNGSLHPPAEHPDYPTFYIDQNDGVNLVWYKLKEFLKENEIDVLVCGHADFYIVEKDWDRKVADAFDSDPKLIMASFVGSSGVGMAGGRGRTYLGFVGQKYVNGQGSPWNRHGQKAEGVIPAGCFDHCVMIYRVSEFDTLLSYFPEAPPMHFEDRILPVAAVYNGWHCAIIGVDCDHLSGAKGSGMDNYHEAVKRWLDKLGRDYPADGGYDHVAYIEAEKQFLGKWRDDVLFIPFSVNSDYSVKSARLGVL